MTPRCCRQHCRRKLFFPNQNSNFTEWLKVLLNGSFADVHAEIRFPYPACWEFLAKAKRNSVWCVISRWSDVSLALGFWSASQLKADWSFMHGTRWSARFRIEINLQKSWLVFRNWMRIFSFVTKHLFTCTIHATVECERIMLWRQQTGSFSTQYTVHCIRLPAKDLLSFVDNPLDWTKQYLPHMDLVFISWTIET